VYTPEKVFLLRVTERREVPVPPHTELWEKAQQELAQISTNVRLQGLMQDWVEGEIGRYTR
jgi:Zn-dependent M32 family carboxypeptidase